MTNSNSDRDSTVYREEMAYLAHERDTARRENWFWRICAALSVIAALVAWWW